MSTKSAPVLHIPEPGLCAGLAGHTVTQVSGSPGHPAVVHTAVGHHMGKLVCIHIRTTDRQAVVVQMPIPSPSLASVAPTASGGAVPIAAVAPGAKSKAVGAQATVHDPLGDAPLY